MTSQNHFPWAGALLGIVTALLLYALLPSSPASAQNYPSKNITIVVPLAAGTGMDSIVRIYAEQLQKFLGKPVIVENQPGSAMQLGTAAVGRAAPDGHTLLVTSNGALAVAPVLSKKINYDPVNGFAPIALYVKSPFILIVDPKLPVRSVADLIKLAKESSPPLTYSTPGSGSVQHLSMESMKQRFGVDITHVPYRNTPQSITDIVGGHVKSSLAEAGATLSLIREGQLRALAVSSSTRLASLPEIPTIAEAANAPNFEASGWHALFAPAGTPDVIIGILRKEIERITATPEFKKRASDIGLIPIDTPTVVEIRSYIKSEQEKWGALVRKLGLEGTQ